MAAAAAYLPFVAFALLLQPRYRDVRLVRFHAYQAIAIGGMSVLVLVGAGLLASLFGAVPGLGIIVNMSVGFAFIAALLGGTGLAFYGAVSGYQGIYTQLPILTDWAWARLNTAEASAQQLAEQVEAAVEAAPEPLRGRRRRKLFEDDEPSG